MSDARIPFTVHEARRVMYLLDHNFRMTLNEARKHCEAGNPGETLGALEDLDECYFLRDSLRWRVDAVTDRDGEVETTDELLTHDAVQ